MKFRLLPAFAAVILGGFTLPRSLSAQETTPAPAAAEKEKEKAAPESGKDEEKTKTGGEYVRFVQDEDAARMEVAVRSFVDEKGRAVDLVGVVHIADASYYKEINTLLAGYAKVLFELVGDPDVLTGKSPPEEKSEPEPDLQFRVLRMLYDFMGTYLHLTFQLSEVDYKHPRFVHADMSAEEFRHEQKERGESLATIMVRSMQIQMKGQLSGESTGMEDLNLAKLIYIVTSPNGAAEFKVLLARTLAMSENLTGRMESESPSVILSERNAVVIKKLRETLRSGDGKIAVFFGAAHMPGLAKTMTEQLGFKPTGEKWLTAWNMPTKPAPRTDAEAK